MVREDPLVDKHQDGSLWFDAEFPPWLRDCEQIWIFTSQILAFGRKGYHTFPQSLPSARDILSNIYYFPVFSSLWTLPQVCLTSTVFELFSLSLFLLLFICVGILSLSSSCTCVWLPVHFPCFPYAVTVVSVCANNAHTMCIICLAIVDGVWWTAYCQGRKLWSPCFGDMLNLLPIHWLLKFHQCM